MNAKSRDMLLAFSAANLVFTPVYLWLFNDPWLSFRIRYPMWTHFASTLVNVSISGSLLYVVIRLYRRKPGRRSRTTLEVGLLIIALLILNGLLSILVSSSTMLAAVLHLKQPLLLVATLVVIGVLGLFLIKKWSHVQKLIRATIVGLSPLLLVDLVWGIQKSIQWGNQSEAKPTVTFSKKSERQMRVVWLVFDEWEYRLTFGERPVGTEFPNLDLLRQQSLFCSDARSPSIRTGYSMPSYLMGKTVWRGEMTSPWRYEFELRDGRKSTFQENSNLFEKLYDQELNSAVVGLYIPYGRLVGRYAQTTWFQWPSEFGASDSFVRSTLGQVGLALGEPFKTLQSRSNLCEITIREVAALQDVVDDTRFTVVFGHLFPPHPPNLFDAKSGRFELLQLTKSKRERYVESLAFVDRTVGSFLKQIKESDAAKDTVFIVTTDHTNRKAAEMDLELDPRIPCMIRFPDGQRLEFRDRINTLALHDLVLGVVRGRIKTVNEASSALREWMRTHPAEPGYEFTDGLMPGNDRE